MMNRLFFFPAQSHKPDEGSGSLFSLIVKIKQTYSGNAQRDTRLKMNIYCEQKTMKPKSFLFSDSASTFTESD